MSRVVWTRSMCDPQPRIHRVDGFKVRPANVDEKLQNGFVPEGKQRTEVATTNCGIAITIWLEEPDPGGRWYRSVRHEGLGVSLLVRHADAIGGRRCKHCWPERAS